MNRIKHSHVRSARDLMKMAFDRLETWWSPRRLESAPPALCDRLRGVTWTGNLLVGCFVLGLGAWSTFAPLESAAIASGTVESESSRKTIQHLEGGIINYVNQVKEKKLPNKFHGKNFVFDDRLGERITEDVIAKCHQCGQPADTHTNCKNDGCHLLFIQCEACAAEYDGCCSEACQHILTLPEEAQKEIRKGVNKGRQVFKKGRSKNILHKPE